MIPGLDTLPPCLVRGEQTVFCIFRYMAGRYRIGASHPADRDRSTTADSGWSVSINNMRFVATASIRGYPGQKSASGQVENLGDDRLHGIKFSLPEGLPCKLERLIAIVSAHGFL